MNNLASLPQPWFQRDWQLWSGSGSIPDLLNKLEEFPTELQNLLRKRDSIVLKHSCDSAWSIQEHVGHLLAMESLWIARIDDFVMKHEFLRPWKGDNNDVRAAKFNEQNIETICNDFIEVRTSIVQFSRQLLQTGAMYTAFHQRLGRNFSLQDQIYFIAEHDAHHLHTILFLLDTTK